MASIKLRYFNNYHFLIKPLALLILCFAALACNKKEAAALTAENRSEIAENAVNINTAPAAELEKLPNVGAVLARKIVEHRERYGDFRKPEHLLLVPGVSESRFRQLRNLIKTE
ncbi:MAG TPA: helix-hairpin-helix domain-containing protein [Pyrinomonadaceae bacterium]|jgi:competence ComEA-like helix-hairpin-helix protein